MSEGRPIWQRDDCPPWCDGEHRDDDHPDDRIHAAAGVGVPVTLRDPDSGEAFEDQLEIALWRRDGDRRTWLHLGASRGNHLEIATPDITAVLDELFRLAGVDAEAQLRELARAVARIDDL
ncbi:hypothetical protein [Microbacterium sp. SORGH_AS_0888]|uniref:DUF6907 domain-containing protein n=1 Tax=Microbacterium sp. SORGH_AS_0888 TaxID=3041791 RepID=UPI002784E6AF|nr:hypothetical protein [Microbacterium sp. SORGH_AS_0888]MDQ1129846.1 hypothetical protein [Microbacterium sp. SORGH_AS_0888]